MREISEDMEATTELVAIKAFNSLISCISPQPMCRSCIVELTKEKRYREGSVASHARVKKSQRTKIALSAWAGS